jgi:hypothetical protein
MTCRELFDVLDAERCRERDELMKLVQPTKRPIVVWQLWRAFSSRSRKQRDERTRRAARPNVDLLCPRTPSAIDLHAQKRSPRPRSPSVLPIPNKGRARRQCIAGWERIPVILSCSSVSIAIGNRTKHYRRPVRVPLSRRRRRVLARQSSYSAIWLDAGDVGRAFHGLELGRYLLVGKAKSNDGSGMQISSEKSSRIGPQDRMTV